MTQRGAVGCAKTLGNPEMAKDAGAWCSRSPHEVTQGLNNREGTPALSQTLSFPYNCPSVMESPEAPPPPIFHQPPNPIGSTSKSLPALLSFLLTPCLSLGPHHHSPKQGYKPSPLSCVQPSSLHGGPYMPPLSFQKTHI